LEDFSAYFDESGVHDDSEMVCVAGFISMPDKWATFEEEWRNSLKEWNLAWYHHKELLDGQGSYRQLSRIRRDALFAQFCSIVNKHVLGGVVVRILREQYNSVFCEDSKLVSGGIYGLAAYHCLMWLGSITEKNFPDCHLRLIFAEGAPHAKQIKKAFATITASYKAKKDPGIIALEFADAHVNPPIQAADMLATEFYLQRKQPSFSISNATGFGIKQLLKKPLIVNDVDLEALVMLNTQFPIMLGVKRKYDREQRHKRRMEKKVR
jgi:hypothetical protein